MRVRERFVQQVGLIEDFIRELESEKSYRGVERLIQLAIQALLDLGLMAISALKARRPRTYSEVGRVLHELGILDRQEAETLRSMAGLRNILVHAYAAVDREKVLGFAENLKRDARHIATKILESVRRSDLDPAGNPELEAIVEKLRRALRGRVKVAYLYGGRAKGYTLKGDYDIAVLIKGGCDPLKLGELQVTVAEALGVNEDMVDVTCLDASPPKLVLEALEGIPIIDNPPEVFNMKLKALRLMLDMQEAERHLNALTSR